MSQPTDPRASGDATNGYDSECRTRAPILWESNAYNWFLEMFGTPQQSVDPALFRKFLQSLADHPPIPEPGGDVFLPTNWSTASRRSRTTRKSSTASAKSDESCRT